MSLQNFNWDNDQNHLHLNPRLPEEASLMLRRTWEGEIQNKFRSQVGIVTSGSSGESFGKLILLSKSALLTNAESVNSRLQSTADDIWLKTLPDFHVGGLSIYARSHLSGARVVDFAPAKWQVDAFYNELCGSSATLLSLVPSQLFDLVDRGYRCPPALRAVILGGARLNEELREKAVNLGWPALPSYGMTECSSQVATATEAEKPALQPLSHVEIRIDAYDRIQLKSPALLTALVEFDRDFKASVFDPKVEGWFTTEDRGRIVSDGSLEILGRSSDFIKIGGEGVIVSRLQERLEGLKLKLQFKGDAALLAASDERLGAKIILMTTANESETRTLVEAFDQSVLPFERIRSVHKVVEIPRSALGKILRVRALAAIGLQTVADV